MKLLFAALAPLALLAQPIIHIKTPMSPPAWAHLERDLLKYNSQAAQRFAAKYVDSRGYLLHTPRWGTLDGPDDAIETYFNWTLLHALGGDDQVLSLYKKAHEGHLKQYNELRTKLTELASNGAYYKEFITQSDWFHTGEGMRGFWLQGLSDPNDELYRARVKRFAGLYMNEDPEAPNYDAQHKIIKSIWTGSKGPMLRKATTYDWVGDPVPGSFHLLHNPASRGKMLDMATHYKKMLAHCDEYLDSAGDNFINLAATVAPMTAYALTGEEKYKNWVLEYTSAWKQRTEANGGMIPSNIGLDGKLGGEHNGQWWKGTYGWNFTIFDGELEAIAHRNYLPVGPWPGFSNALLVSGDQSYIGVLRKQLDLIYARKKEENGRVMLPQMYGDPKGYKGSGAPAWYQYTGDLLADRLMEIYQWSQDPKDLEKVLYANSANSAAISGGRARGASADRSRNWLEFLQGKRPNYPVESLQADLAQLRRKVEMIRQDVTTADTRLADYLLDYNPVMTDTLTNLTTGGYFSRGRIWVLHSRFRYFDPEKRRAGLPADVAALVEKMDAASATLTLVNTNPVEPRTITIQGGTYGEHQLETATVNGQTTNVNAPTLTVRLEPGSGATLAFATKRYANRPTLAFPWDRGWYAQP